MCIGRIDQYHCGCYTGPKIFRCEPAQKNEKCDGIGPLITANILSFCDVCMERRKNNTIELKRIIDESRQVAEAKAEAKAEAIRATKRQAEIDAIDINTPPLTVGLAGLNAAEGAEKTGVEVAETSNNPGDEKERNLSLNNGSRKEATEKLGFECNVNEVAHDEHFQPTCSSRLRNFAKVFCGCFKKA
ncbi:hypothetical protein DL98DRAFT_606116 [Cadophora sp. DSE1049]|nr:hypothetical protein DL98DRAFT_606116 [Cadophora sp. DSE1049]